jgi:murein L,D-transpeptidase YafK
MRVRSPHIVASLLVLSLVTPTASVAAGTFLTRQLRAPRVSAALKAQAAALRGAFDEAHAAWPPRELFLRGFKHEGVLEVWAGAAQGRGLVRIWALPLCARSGVLGPKRREGDGQIPEGLYRIHRFNPRSSFHLSLGLNYPTAVDRARAGEGDPGSDIFIHGGCASIGCLAIEDGPIEMLYLAAVMARDRGQRGIPVHLFPCRFGGPECDAQLSERSGHPPDTIALWRSLKATHDAFDGATDPATRSTSNHVGHRP